MRKKEFMRKNETQSAVSNSSLPEGFGVREGVGFALLGLLALGGTSCGGTTMREETERRLERSEAQGAKETCVAFQRGSGGGVADAKISNRQPDKRFGDDPVASVSSVNGHREHVLLRFDTRDIPSQATLTSATLSLWQINSGQPASLWLHSMTAPWQEGNVTWNSHGAAYDPSAATTFDAPGGEHPAVHNLDISSLVSAWVKQPEINHGLLLAQPKGKTLLATSESPHLERRPRLEVCYTERTCTRTSASPFGAAWSPTGALVSGRVHHTVTRLSSGKVLTSGGGDSSGCFSTAEVYDPCTATWSSTSAMMSARCFQGASLLPSGEVLVSGGIRSHDEWPLTSVELFNPATGSWRAAGSMRTARYSHSSTVLHSGNVLVVGGDNGDWGGSILTSAEVYDPATGSWHAAAPMAALRAHHTATLLPSGKVLVVGGHNNSAPVNLSAELYDPATNSWTPAGSMSWPRYHHRATLLPSGKVLITGGTNHSGPLSSAELYDPASSSWSYAGSMASSRYVHTATLLSSGKVLVAGGSDRTSSLASAELYDPATQSWSTVANMSRPLSSLKATLLDSGEVLVVGGSDGHSFPTTAELFIP